MITFVLSILPLTEQQAGQFRAMAQWAVVNQKGGRMLVDGITEPDALTDALALLTSLSRDPRLIGVWDTEGEPVEGYALHPENWLPVAPDYFDGDNAQLSVVYRNVHSWAGWGFQKASVDTLPDAGAVMPGAMFARNGVRWRVIQQHNRSTYGGDPAQYPALIRRVRDPGVVEAWTQPLDQYDAYAEANIFTGKPDECYHAGKHWRGKAGNGAGLNVWEPGVFGWEEIGADPNPQPEPDEWPLWVQPTGGHDAYKLGAKVTHNGQRWLNTGSDANVWEPSVFGWTVQP